MESAVIIALLGFAITIVLFIVSQFNSNQKFKRNSELAYAKFETETHLKLAEFNKELTALKDKIQLNKTEIIETYKQYRNETVEHTQLFREETLLSLKDNKTDHAEIHDRLTTVLSDLSFIKGKLSHTTKLKPT
jgi:hypothetical protein